MDSLDTTRPLSEIEEPRRPGISPETLGRSGVQVVKETKGKLLPGSLEIPYYDISGKRTGFSRFRLSEPIGEQRYYQEPGSGSRAYLPPQLVDIPRSDFLVIVEGEFKALSLIDAGVAAIGLPSFGTYTKEGDVKVLLAGISNVLELLKPKKVYFLGDSDTATNSEFSRYALFLAKELMKRGIEALLPRIPINGPGKGIDDCREELGEGFNDWWLKLLSESESIDVKSCQWALALQLLEREAEEIRTLRGGEKSRHHRRVEDMIRRCDDSIQHSKLINIGYKILGVTKTELKSICRTEHKESDSGGVGKHFREVEPYPEPVTTAELLAELVESINRHCYLQNHAAIAVAGWIMNTYVYNRFPICPLLYLISPTRRCGKTTLLEVIHALSHKPFSTSGPSTAAVFRIVDEHAPTLLIDEADECLSGKDELAGIINAGHRKIGATVHRCEGDSHKVREFNTYCPKAIAGIDGAGRIKSTTEDRAIVIRMERKSVSDSLEYFDFESTFRGDLPRKLARWAADVSEQLDAQPRFDLLENDRANDNCNPLMKIAELAGSDWKETMVQAARALTTRSQGDSISIGEMLLIDIKGILAERRWLKFTSEDMTSALHEFEDKPWSEFGRKQDPITPRGLAGILGRFGIKPIRDRFESRGGKQCRGYKASQFSEAFQKYVIPFEKASQVSQAAHTNQSVTFSNAGCQQFTDPVTDVTDDSGIRDAEMPSSELLGQSVDFEGRTEVKELVQVKGKL